MAGRFWGQSFIFNNKKKPPTATTARRTMTATAQPALESLVVVVRSTIVERSTGVLGLLSTVTIMNVYN